MRLKPYVVVGLIALGYASRLLEHPYNFTPVIALAFIAAIYLRPRALAFVLPLLGTWLSDIVLNNTRYAEYYDGFSLFGDPGTYLGIAAAAGLVLLARLRASNGLVRLAGGTLLAATAFFVVSNFVVWLSGTLYTLDFAGLLECYTAALPFFRGTLSSTVLYGLLGVLAFRTLHQFVPALRLSTANA